MLLSLQNFHVNNRIVRILLVALLIFAMVFCAFMYQMETAHALVLEGMLLSVVASLLVSAGFGFLTQENLEAACRSFLDFATSDVVTIITGIVSSIGSAGHDMLFKAPPALISAVAEWYSSLDLQFIADAELATNGGFTLPEVNKVDIDGFNFDWCNVYSSEFFRSLSSEERTDLMISFPLNLPFSLPRVGTFATTTSFMIKQHSVYDGCYNIEYVTSSGNVVTSNYQPIFGFCITESATGSMRLYYATSSTFYSFPLTVDDSQVTTTTFPQTEQKVDTTYFPNGVTSSNPSTTFPSNTASKPLTPDIPINVPSDAGTLVGAPPASNRGDSTTGEGDLTITGWLSKLWESIKSIPGAIVDAITALFLPTATIWNDFMNDIVKIVSPPQALDFDKYVSSIAIPDVTGTFKGQTLTFVDNQMLRDNVATWRKYLSAFFWALILIFNYNMFMKLFGMGHITLTDSGKVQHQPISIDNLAGNQLPPPKGKW